MDIRYAYPNSHLLRRLRSLPYIGDDFPLDPLEHISDLVERLAEQFGDRILTDLPNLLRTGSISPPALSTIEAWLEWIETEYIPREPQILSPGAMSNAPDRLDGFHSFNLCCRSTSDTGRTKDNLQSYTTDRRVFEYWVEGDWVAADRLMGLLRSSKTLQQEPCLNGHPGPCSADHIGPISLGFVHRPIFQFLCKACNSAKNNRMTLRDVTNLQAASSEGIAVASWYSRELWRSRNRSVQDDEMALRLSKLLRDNRHTVMALFGRLASEGHFAFLCTFLELEHAMFNVEFINVHAEDHLTQFDAMNRSPRTTKYGIEQKARRIRVAFAALRDYVEKENRNAFVITTPQIESKIEEALEALRSAPQEIRSLDQSLQNLVLALNTLTRPAIFAIFWSWKTQ
jgi:Alw26I/Eco31I/Esp3I family type II restriction endonuclease